LYSPIILLASDIPLPEMQVAAPQQVERGSKANIAIHAERAHHRTTQSASSIDRLAKGDAVRKVEIEGSRTQRAPINMKNEWLAVQDSDDPRWQSQILL
jgi:hypothetical protein